MFSKKSQCVVLMNLQESISGHNRILDARAGSTMHVFLR
jgi:hypothetical protein